MTASLPVDAINYCHNKSLFYSQLNAAQSRCNFNRTTELVIWLDDNGDAIASQVITANRQLPGLACNLWK